MRLLEIANANKLRIASLVVAVTMMTVLAAPAGKVLAEELTPATDGNKNVTTGEVAEALRETPNLLAASDQVKTSSDADSAMKAVTSGVTVDIPKDASEGVTLADANGSTKSIDVSLPNADASQDGKQVAPGTVAYAAGNGSANAVQATEDGGVRMLTVIDNPNAPTSYDYKVSVPGGGRIVLAEGGAAVLDANDSLVALVGAPWAKDANGNAVQTYFTTDGQKLTQHILHNVAGVAYPVTADPFWIPAWVLWACGIGFLSGGAGYWVGGGTSFWRFLASGGVGCVFGIIGKKF